MKNDISVTEKLFSLKTINLVGFFDQWNIFKKKNKTFSGSLVKLIFGINLRFRKLLKPLNSPSFLLSFSSFFYGMVGPWLISASTSLCFFLLPFPYYCSYSFSPPPFFLLFYTHCFSLLSQLDCNCSPSLCVCVYSVSLLLHSIPLTLYKGPSCDTLRLLHLWLLC